MTINTTRRAMLAGAAVLPAVALAGPNAIASTGVTDPKLAAEFEAFYAGWRAQFLADENRRMRFYELVEAATGIPRDRAPDRDEPGYEEYKRVWDEISKEDKDPDPELTRWTDLNHSRDEIALKILQQPARTIGDVALQARAFALANTEIWIDDPTSEEPYRSMRYLTESVGKFAGLDNLLPGLPIAPIPEDNDEEPTTEPKAAVTKREEPDDPIFAIIDKHKAAYQAFLTKQKVATEVDASRPSEKKWLKVERALERARDRELEALSDVFNAPRPETFAGLCALGLYAAKQLEISGDDLLVKHQDHCAILRTLVSYFSAWPDVQEILKQKAIEV